MTKVSVLGREPVQKRVMEGETIDGDSGPIGGREERKDRLYLSLLCTHLCFIVKTSVYVPSARIFIHEGCPHLEKRWGCPLSGSVDQMVSKCLLCSGGWL